LAGRRQRTDRRTALCRRGPQAGLGPVARAHRDGPRRVEEAFRPRAPRRQQPLPARVARGAARVRGAAGGCYCCVRDGAGGSMRVDVNGHCGGSPEKTSRFRPRWSAGSRLAAFLSALGRPRAKPRHSNKHPLPAARRPPSASGAMLGVCSGGTQLAGSRQCSITAKPARRLIHGGMRRPTSCTHRSDAKWLPVGGEEAEGDVTRQPDAGGRPDSNESRAGQGREGPPPAARPERASLRRALTVGLQEVVRVAAVVLPHGLHQRLDLGWR
jgi:hypothetical protein